MVVGVGVVMVSMSVIISSAVWRGRVVEVSVVVLVVVVVVAMVSMSVILASAVWRDGSVEVSMVVVVVVVVVALADKGESSWVRGS
jgi:hypothetical protein